MSRAAAGLRAWLVQRITAVYLGLFSLYLIFCFALTGVPDYASWSGWLRQPLVSIGWGIYLVCLLLHVWVGIRDVLIDYIKPVGVRVSLMAVVMFTLLGCGLWGLRALLFPVLSA